GTGSCGTCVSTGPGIQDLCGDISNAGGGHNPTYYKITNITMTCLDTDNDGFLDVNAITSWRESGANDLCRSPVGAFPGAPSKCKKQATLKIPINVPKTIQVCKDIVPNSDTGKFNLQLDATSFYCSDGSGTCASGSGACSDGTGTCMAA